ncbi:O-methylsterigmatocystin oxidoreductase Short=OMST oxidoreductase; AltName: Full=Aflatoxin B synthase; AltName: Full=Aflatoxin biosynthesis protein Q; AltName: Full=Cytochrome P450 64 [Serendipita indica DSM 11827]|nr:O-methylsterigmatocystin oxidoreductase Short=OMST oxidoreductase; AltName: Full=Aflatoxin B synthase; AltName: Full=Aflatoxin biosynthesis protein Q; AltName: Full=Cytochrome P450 64 [Serendipita indica DSM 11827]
MSLPSLSSSHLWASGAAILGLTTWYISRHTATTKAKRRGAVLAPGPRRVPFLGNVFNFPRGRWYETFTQWAGDYGDIIYIDLAGVPMIILNSLEAIHELTDKRMSIHSGRPHTTFVCDMIDCGYFTSMIQPSRDFTDQRRIFQRAIGPHTVNQYDSFIQHSCSQLLQQLDGFSGEPFNVLTKTVGNVLTRIAYGEHFFQHHGAEALQKTGEGIELFTWAFTKFWFVDVIPALRHIPAWFPGAKFKRIASQGKDYADYIRYWPFNQVKATMAEGITDESIVFKYLQEGGISEDNLRDAVATMYGAGVDTTSSTISNFLFSVALYPEWQKQIHEEMDQVLGRGNQATLDDIPKLELFQVVFKESFRWNTAAPLGVPHVSSKEDVWNGYYIPKNSIIHCNIGFVLRDPRLWGKDSLDFNPNRFLASHNPSVDKLPDIWSVPFGFGRRICPGRYLAQRTALLYSAAILSMYEVLPFEGDILSPEGPFEDSVIRRLSNFQCKFKPRA